MWLAISLTSSDLEKIRIALRVWGKSQEVVDNFSETRLQEHYGNWSQFVDNDWENWDISEYIHDIGCRYWIQIAIENSGGDTAKNLERLVQPIDDRFKVKMQPCQTVSYASKDGLLNHPYFWETHAIHPELSREKANTPEILLIGIPPEWQDPISVRLEAEGFMVLYSNTKLEAIKNIRSRNFSAIIIASEMVFDNDTAQDIITLSYGKIPTLTIIQPETRESLSQGKIFEKVYNPEAFQEFCTTPFDMGELVPRLRKIIQKAEKHFGKNDEC